MSAAIVSLQALRPAAAGRSEREADCCSPSQQRAPHLRSQADSGSFRDALAQFATGITVVTACVAGARIGVTVNSFASVSLDPPLILWSLANASSRSAAFRTTKRFAVNVLAAAQHDVAVRFSLRQADAFCGVECADDSCGVPLIAGCVAHFVCRSTRQIPAGDHLIFLGEVDRFRAYPGNPLLFHGRRFAELSPDSLISPRSAPAR